MRVIFHTNQIIIIGLHYKVLKTMNILFVLKSLEIGGVEVVTSVLANKFSLEGHRVTIFAFSEGERRKIETLGASVKLVIGKGFCISEDNVKLLKDTLQEDNIAVIINQWGLPLVPIKVINKARTGLGVKVITVFHNDPLQNGRIQGVNTEIEKTTNLFKKTLLSVKRFVYRCVTGYAMRYNYTHSDVFEVLSPSFVANFKNFTKIKNPKKLVVQTNPITLGNEGFKYDENKKEKEILYVGRLDNTQKRVYRIIETWNLLEFKHPDWRLTFVGDGEEREEMQRLIIEMRLKNVHFEGFQSPRKYYERASILILTSEFEGFPLVLAECMSFGVVPVVYGSYPAVFDIIEDGKDGEILMKEFTGFNEYKMSEKLELLMTDQERLDAMAFLATKKSKNYSIDIIYQHWLKVLR